VSDVAKEDGRCPRILHPGDTRAELNTLVDVGLAWAVEIAQQEGDALEERLELEKHARSMRSLTFASKTVVCCTNSVTTRETWLMK